MKFGMTVSGSNIGLTMESTCKHCGEPIKRRAQNGPWKHVGGSYACEEAEHYPTSNDRAEPKDKP